jgi:hypothetical protein
MVRSGLPVNDLRYTPLERLSTRRPVDRVHFVLERCRGKAVLDLGCYDETALVKQGTAAWLHGEIARVARCVLGVDGSDEIPLAGLETGPTSRILKGDVTALAPVVREADVEVVVAGELIEHLPNTLAFLEQLRRSFPGRELVATTPNSTSLTNVLLGVASRESNHHDHLQIYSYKTLCTLCRRVGFPTWDIVPYHVRYTEMALRSGPARRRIVGGVEAMVNACEWALPLLSGGLILHVAHM